jgi:hypothetical protein
LLTSYLMVLNIPHTFHKTQQHYQNHFLLSFK